LRRVVIQVEFRQVEDGDEQAVFLRRPLCRTNQFPQPRTWKA
jgi:hypothetical protein